MLDTKHQDQHMVWNKQLRPTSWGKTHWVSAYGSIWSSCSKLAPSLACCWCAIPLGMFYRQIFRNGAGCHWSRRKTNILHVLAKLNRTTWCRRLRHGEPVQSWLRIQIRTPRRSAMPCRPLLADVALFLVFFDRLKNALFSPSINAIATVFNQANIHHLTFNRVKVRSRSQSYDLPATGISTDTIGTTRRYNIPACGTRHPYLSSSSPVTSSFFLFTKAEDMTFVSIEDLQELSTLTALSFSLSALMKLKYMRDRDPFKLSAIAAMAMTSKFLREFF